MAHALRAAAGPGVEWPAAPAQAEVQLVALVDAREKVVASYTAARRVSEFQLRVRLRWRAQTPAGRVLLPDSELLLTRELSYGETQALGKEYEEARLYADMEADIAQQLMRRLALLRL
jgi:LPS-assembly lipoprotein